MYKIFGIAQSRTFRVLWMLEEIGERYEHIPAKPHSSEIIKLNISNGCILLLDIYVISLAIILLCQFEKLKKQKGNNVYSS